MTSEQDNRLPYELWDHILSLVLDKHVLAQICAVNSILRRVAARHLYQAIHINDLSRMKQLYRALSSHPGLATCTRALHLDVRRYCYRLSYTVRDAPIGLRIRTPPSPFFSAGAFLRLFAGLLRLFGNLTTLTLLCDVRSESMDGCLSMKLACLPSRLTTLTLQGVDSFGLLNTQVNLTHLRFHRNRYGIGWLDPRLDFRTSVPLLRHLITDTANLGRLADGRPLEEFQLHGGDVHVIPMERLAPHLLMLSRSIGPLKRASLDLSSIGSGIFEMIGVALPSLEALGLTVSDIVTSLSFLGEEQTLQGLRHFRALGRLEMHVYIEESVVDLDVAQILAHIPSVCSTLKIIPIAFEGFSRSQADGRVLDTLPVYHFRKVESHSTQGISSWLQRKRIHKRLFDEELSPSSDLFGFTSAGELVGDRQRCWEEFDRKTLRSDCKVM